MSRVSDGPDYDFGPYEDEYRGFTIRDDETGRGPLILVLALGVLLIFAGVVWNTYRQGVRPTEGGLPIIASDSAPYKRAPEERGGLTVAGQDNGFYGQMDGMGDPASSKVSVRNPAEIRRGTPTLAGAPVEPSDLPPIGDPVETATPVRTATLDAPDNRSLTTGENGEIKVAALQPMNLKPRQEPTTRVETPPAIVDTVASRFSAEGNYLVQLLAVRSEDNARAEWNKFKARDPNLYSGAHLHIQRADLGAKGVFYRLRVGAFETRAAAAGFCADVKAAGKDCIVVAKATG